MRYNVGFLKTMERAANLLRQYPYAGRCVTPAELVQAAWPRAVGKKIAAHSKVDSLWNGRLTVSVDDAIWRDQLTTLAGQILWQVDKAVGGNLVRWIEFRVGVRRRGPVRADRSQRISNDDPDGIADPILGHIYQAAKKRASA